MAKTRLTEEQKKAISFNLGHANVGTTFGSYGYGNMSKEDAIDIVKSLKSYKESTSVLSDEEKSTLEKIMQKVL